MMPKLAAYYGLKWADIEAMPFDELREHIHQLPDIMRMLASAQLVNFED